jgi:hypothetical protein
MKEVINLFTNYNYTSEVFCCCCCCLYHNIIILFLLVEIATLTRENDKTRIRILTEKEINELIKKHEDEQIKLDAEKQAKEKQAQSK